ncbi:AbrB/MazE/SpoVT family DNA-binding domain-containing protein, partial [Escherichia coli]|uniref:AbrB/MazE/SpoVT family DNA-binding domain-containing protein n=1 Tax=Escherichia coli TaxID=562 RepID=UPI003D9585D2
LIYGFRIYRETLSRFSCAASLSATGYHPMPSEYDEQLDSTDTQLPGEYNLFDLMAQVTEENLHAPVDFGPPVGREVL